MNRQQAVIFDLDGTLLDTLEDLAASGNELLSHRGFPTHPVEDYKTFIGNGMDNLVRAIFPEGHRPFPGTETDAMVEEYRAAYRRHWKDTTSLFPGMSDLLDRLAEREIPLAVLSNKAHDFTQNCVDTFLGEWQWAVVFGAREGLPKKPDPAGAHEIADEIGIPPASCFFIGDSDVDMITADRAGMHAVGVSWGFRSIDELTRSGATAILERPIDLLGIMEQSPR